MADFAPPAGPPPPKVPEGWKAVWNDQYNEYFYVNIYTKTSQWDKPTQPVYPPGEAPPDGPPPYNPSGAAPRSSTEKNAFSSNNPYGAGTSPRPDISEDERLARRLQEEEQSRAQTSGDHGGAANSYYSQASMHPGGSSAYPQGSNQAYPQDSNQYGDRSHAQDKGSKAKGLLGKLMGKSSSSGHQGGGYPQQHGGMYGQPMGGAYGQPMGGAYGQPMGGGYGQPMGGYGGYGQPGYYPQQQMYGRQPKKGGGMGAAGGAALGLGGGLLAGTMLGSAMADGGDDGDYGDDGGDMGGDDFGE